MFNATQVVIETFVNKLSQNYLRVYGKLEPEYPTILQYIGRLALENIANSDAAYHDINHTIMVTDAGQEILRGKHVCEGGVSPFDWLHFVISLLCHDIGYVRGVCKGDKDGRYVVDETGETITLAAGATDASLTPHHVNRSKLFVAERFSSSPMVDTEVVRANIEHTRFPVPEGESHENIADYPGLVRAADLIGQMADINYLRKGAALFAEFQETGTAKALGFATPADLRANYPKFFWHMVTPYISTALDHLRVTQEGKIWIASLFAHVFAEEHAASALGPERNSVS